MDEPQLNERPRGRHEALTRERSAIFLTRAGTIVGSLRGFDRFIFYTLVAVVTVSAFALLARANDALMVEVPAPGGKLVEGIVGTPRFINPLLASTDADRDLTALVFEGLMRATVDGTLIPALAERYSVSEDGKMYTFTLRDGAVFHDGSPVTADDVVFTVTKALDPILKSPRRASWEGVTVEKKDERTVIFTLRQPYTPFLENTTMGILPKALWEGVSPEQFPFSTLNSEPVGAGAYRLKSVHRSASGIPDSYVLTPFTDYVLQQPLISTLTFHFFDRDEDALRAAERGTVESVAGISPERLLTLSLVHANVLRSPLPRIFAVFFNQNQAPVFALKEVREALSLASPRGEIVRNVLYGYGTPIDSPIPPGAVPELDRDVAAEANVAAAAAVLEKAGWTKNEETGIWEKKTRKETTILAFTLSTSNAPELRAAAEILKAAWERFGASVTLEVYETGDLNQNIIRPRKYDALFFGEIVGRELDLFPFWHSSQRNDPGLNVALYVNSAADKALQQERSARDAKSRLAALTSFLAEIDADMPAVFLYAPDFIYVIPDSLKGVRLGFVTTPAERFLNIAEWHVTTEKVWNFFTSHYERTE